MTPPRIERRRDLLLTAFRITAIALAAVNVAAAIVAESMSEDGINYLDQGDAWMRGDWDVAINGTWSPLYSVILGLVLRIVRPPMHWEFAVAHVVNFGIFLLALACFEFLWRQATDRYDAAVTAESSRADRLPRWAFQGAGYGLFIWATVTQIRLFAVTPDMLVAAVVFLAGGLMLRLPATSDGRRTMIALGAALGAGYLGKAVLFPLAIAAFAIVALWLRRASRPLRLLLPGLAAFALVAAPFLIALSLETGRPTFGEVGRVTYLKHVLHAPFPHYESGSPHIAGAPLHPIARSETSPPVHTFAGPPGVTYPLAYDQGHWYAGLRPRFRPALQLQAIALNLQRYFELFVRGQGLMLGAILVVLLTRRLQRPFAASGWLPGVFGLSALGLYSLVYAEGRYLAPFVVLIWTALLLSVRLRQSEGQSGWLAASGAVVILSLFANIAVFHLDGFNALVRIAPVASAGPVSRTSGVSARPSDVAGALRYAGLTPGAPIGVIGEAVAASWARLARLRIVADVAPGRVQDFWAAPPDEQHAVLAAFARAGATAVVAEPPATGEAPPGWTPLGDTGYLARVTDGGARSRGVRAPTP
ncbi:MAG TPA: hypothetical protein VK922_12015 [Gemmatimonadaceae bacterium]|nr:hypothetical protein [Gemmatimonadaceae bacterium]